MDKNILFPIFIGALVLLAIFRRVRGSIGRQPVRPLRMRFRIIVLSVLGVVFATLAMRDMALLGGLLAGVAGGVALGWFGLQHTKFESTDEGAFYTPHTWIGLAVSLLLLGRIAYRFMVVYPGMQAATQADQDPFASFQRSPLTLAILGVLIGYYVFYYSGVLRTSSATVRE